MFAESTVIGEDDASQSAYGGNWDNSKNGGSGFSNWTLTTEGNDKNRLKFGTASWVYGEELYQTTAIWWSTNSSAGYILESTTNLSLPFWTPETNPAPHLNGNQMNFTVGTTNARKFFRLRAPAP